MKAIQVQPAGGWVGMLWVRQCFSADGTPGNWYVSIGRPSANLPQGSATGYPTREEAVAYARTVADGQQQTPAGWPGERF